MNIVKFKDIPHSDINYSEIWNKFFRDKWCYAVQLTTFFPIKDPRFNLIGLNTDQYIWLESNLQDALLTPELALTYGINLSEIPYMIGVESYIDMEATKQRNNLNNVYVDNTLSNYNISL